MRTRAADHLNATVWARLGPSAIHGVGVIAIRDIAKGTPITDYRHDSIPGHWNYSRKHHNPVVFYSVSRAEWNTILPEIRSLIADRMLYSESDHHLNFPSPNHDQLLQSFMNHSDFPNSYDMVATRDIRKGEEITEDFRLLFDVPHPVTKAHHSFLYV